MTRWQICLAGSVLSALLLAALFPPLNLAALAPTALAPLLYAMAHEPCGRRRFLWSWLCGFLYWLLVCHWIRDTLAAFGGLSGPLSWLAVILFAIAKGLHTAAFGWLAGMVMNRAWAIPAVAALWTGIERTHGPLGFAWLTLGNAGISLPLPLRAAPLLGVYGISFIFAALACGLTLAMLKRDRRRLAWLLALPLLWLLPSPQANPQPGEQAVAMQTNIPGDFTWTMEEKDRAIRHLSVMTLAESLEPSKEKPSLVLWPEAPAPFYYYEDPEFRLRVSEVARLSSAPFVLAGVSYTASKQPLNSALLLGARGQLSGRYDKSRLVPFGEFVPAGFRWIEKISSEAGDYAPGPGAKVLITGDHTLGVFICYESAFPDYVRQFAASGAEVLVNLTNDGYYGDSAARGQHLLLARMRAVENGRWLLRPSNDGVTASIDPAGRVWDRLPEYQRTAGRLRFTWERALTPYSRFGDWFAWLCLAAGLAAAAAAQIPTYRPNR
ncbi:MAG: apolipoprotein N-acyltransferase [Acidobacteria bacterium]|nr:apolipoprotein N-acyltransferase [Acidobacteriota bacterium]